MPRIPRLPVVAAMTLAACATPESAGKPLAMRSPTAVDVPAPAFERQGEIQLTPVGTAGLSAAWDARSVRGPAVNMTLTDQDLWGGTILDRVVLLQARDGRITGGGVDLRVRQDGPNVRVYGMWFGALLRVDVTPQTISASPLTGVCALELGLAEDGFYRGFGGCGGRLDMVWMKLKGVAADPTAEMPQWLFAFLASLPAPPVSTLRGTVAAAAAAAAGAADATGGGIPTFLPPEFRGSPPVIWSQAQPGCAAVGGLPACEPWGRYLGGKAVTIDSFSTVAQDRAATGRTGSVNARAAGGGRSQGLAGRYASAGPLDRAPGTGAGRGSPGVAARRAAGGGAVETHVERGAGAR